MLFKFQLFFSTLALLARLGTVGAWPAGNVTTGNATTGNVSSPETIGIPSATTPTIPITGNIGGILICRDWGWVNCTYTVQPLKTCIVMNEIWNDTISSIGPDNGTVVIAFADTRCQGNGTALIYPGTSNLSTLGWNDEISSLKVLSVY